MTKISKQTSRPQQTLVGAIIGACQGQSGERLLGRPLSSQGRPRGWVPGLPRAALKAGMMCINAKDIIVRRVELHHPQADDGGRYALPSMCKFRIRS